MNNKTLIELILSTLIYCVLLTTISFKTLASILFIFHGIRIVWQMKNEEEIEETKKVLEPISHFGKGIQNLVVFTSLLLAMFLMITPIGIRKIIFKKEESKNE